MGSLLEDHSSGDKHFLVASKLSTTLRWRPIFEYLRNENDISVNISSSNCDYLAANRYVYKEKSFESVLHSLDHPSLKDVKSPVSNKRRKPSQKMLENDVNLLLALPQVHP